MVFRRESRGVRVDSDPADLLLSMIIDGVKQVIINDAFFKTLGEPGKVLVTLSALEASNKVSADETIRVVRELINGNIVSIRVRSVSSLAAIYLKLEGVEHLRVEGYVDEDSFDILRAQYDRVLLRLLGVIDSASDVPLRCPLPTPAYSSWDKCRLEGTKIVCTEKQPELVITFGGRLAEYLKGLGSGVEVKVRIGFALKTPFYLARLLGLDTVELTPFISILAETGGRRVQVGVYPHLSAATDVFAGRVKEVLSRILGVTTDIVVRSNAIIVKRMFISSGAPSSTLSSPAWCNHLCDLYRQYLTGKKLGSRELSYLLHSIIVLGIFPPSCGFEYILAHDAYEDSSSGLVIREPELVGITSVSSGAITREEMSVQAGDRSNEYFDAWLKCLQGLYSAVSHSHLNLGDLIAGTGSLSLKAAVFNEVFKACEDLLGKLC